MFENEEYTIHNDYNRIISAINELREKDEETTKKLVGFVSKIMTIDNRLKPAMKRQVFYQNERELWKIYQTLQGEKLAILDLAHEWDYVESTSTGLTEDCLL